MQIRVRDVGGAVWFFVDDYAPGFSTGGGDVAGRVCAGDAGEFGRAFRTACEVHCWRTGGLVGVLVEFDVPVCVATVCGAEDWVFGCALSGSLHVLAVSTAVGLDFSTVGTDEEVFSGVEASAVCFAVEFFGSSFEFRAVVTLAVVLVLFDVDEFVPDH